MKETLYSTKFDYIENELLTLGKTFQDIYQTMSMYDQDRFSLTIPCVFMVRRARYIDSIKDELREMYNEVNQDTKLIIDCLYIRNLTFEETSKELCIKPKRLLFRHKLIVDEMLERLGEVSPQDVKKRHKYRKGIPQKVKEIVYKRDSGKCTVCGCESDLHIHHIKRYADGGEDIPENLTLLCVKCHAEEHKDEPSYNLLLAMKKESVSC